MTLEVQEKINITLSKPKTWVLEKNTLENEQNGNSSKNQTKIYHIIQQFHFQVYFQKQKAGTQTAICMPIFTAALFTKAKTQKQPKCLSTDDWKNKIWYIHKDNRTLFGLKKEGNSDTYQSIEEPEDTVLNELNKSQKDRYHMTLITYSSQSHINRKQNAGCQGLRGGGNEELLLSEHRTGKRKKF